MCIRNREIVSFDMLEHRPIHVLPMLPNSFSGGLRNDSLLIDFLLLNRIGSYFQQLLFYGVNTSNRLMIIFLELHR